MAECTGGTTFAESIKEVATHLPDIETVVGNIGDVNTVGQNIADVSSLAENMADVKLLNESIEEVSTVAENMPSVLSVNASVAAIENTKNQVLSVAQEVEADRASVLTTKEQVETLLEEVEAKGVYVEGIKVDVEEIKEDFEVHVTDIIAIKQNIDVSVYAAEMAANEAIAAAEVASSVVIPNGTAYSLESSDELMNSVLTEMVSMKARESMNEQFDKEQATMTEHSKQSIENIIAGFKNFDLVDFAAVEGLAEFIRQEKSTGVMTTQQRSGIVKEPYKQPIAQPSSPITLHNHSNYKAMVGLGMLHINANGYTFMTRHNDARLFHKKPNGGYLEVVESAPPQVPVSINGTVAEQVTKMQSLFKRYSEKKLTTSEKSAFTWDLEYAEVWWEIVDELDTEVEDTFLSFRHSLTYLESMALLQKMAVVKNTGKKALLENLTYLPMAVKIDTQTGQKKFALLRYKIQTHKIPAYNGKHHSEFTTELDDVVANVRFGGMYSSDNKKRFHLEDLDGMLATAAIPSVGGANENFTHTTVDNAEIVSPLNLARYHRIYTINRDAMGDTTYANGWNDPMLIVAETQNTKVFGGVSYMIPLEMILRTPLESWNPYSLPILSSRPTGSGAVVSPFSGVYENSNWYMTPAEFYTGTAASSTADTGGVPVYIRDMNGIARKVSSSGLFITLAPIGNVTERIRIRVPIVKMAHEYGPDGILASSVREESLQADSTMLAIQIAFIAQSAINQHIGV